MFIVLLKEYFKAQFLLQLCRDFIRLDVNGKGEFKAVEHLTSYRDFYTATPNLANIFSCPCL